MNENNSPQEEQEGYPELHVEDAVAILLKPYVPCDDPAEATKTFTTSEIMQALELHYAVPQGTTDFFNPADGFRVVKKLEELGFKYANTGGLQLEWLMKERK